MKRVILITGTPCVGKTALSQVLVPKLDAFYINLTDFAKDHNLILGEDKKRKTIIVDEKKMKKKLAEAITATDKATVIVDGHYATAVTPKRHVTRVFVLRRSPIELKGFMEKAGFPEAKLYENLSAEILDVCLIEALKLQKDKVCELDVTGKTIEETANQVLDIVEKNKKCYIGTVDWLGMLEHEGLTDKYLHE